MRIPKQLLIPFLEQLTTSIPSVNSKVSIGRLEYILLSAYLYHTVSTSLREVSRWGEAVMMKGPMSLYMLTNW